MTATAAKTETKSKLRLIDDPGARQTALRIGYKATDWIERPAYQEYTSKLAGWRVSLLVNNRQPIGAVYTRDEEFHVSVLPKWRGKWETRGLLNKIIPQPFAVTKVTPGYEHVGDLLMRLGFTAGENGVFTKGTPDGI